MSGCVHLPGLTLSRRLEGAKSGRERNHWPPLPSRSIFLCCDLGFVLQSEKVGLELGCSGETWQSLEVGPWWIGDGWKRKHPCGFVASFLPAALQFRDPNSASSSFLGGFSYVFERLVNTKWPVTQTDLPPTFCSRSYGWRRWK